MRSFRRALARFILWAAGEEIACDVRSRFNRQYREETREAEQELARRHAAPEGQLP